MLCLVCITISTRAMAYVYSHYIILLLFLGGGEMISDVFYDHSTYQEPPSRLVNSPTY